VFIGNSELLAEGEGALHASIEDCDKRSKSDFALWKKSKDHGEVGSMMRMMMMMMMIVDGR
jgi:hypothetical protein